MKESTTAGNKKKKQNIVFRLLALLVTIGLVLGALTLVVYRDRFNLDALKRWMSYRTVSTSDTGEAEPFPYAGGQKLALAYLDNGLLTACDAGTHFYSFDGEQYAEVVVSLENPVLSAAEKAAVVYDAGGDSMYLFKGTEAADSLTLEGGGDILSARVNNSGWLAVTAQESGYKGAVTVYNAQQEKIIGINLSSTFLVDAAVSPDCKTVAVVTMSQTAGTFESQLILYSMDSKEPKATVSLGDIAVLDLEFETNRIWVVGEDTLLILSADGSTTTTYPFGRYYLKGCSLGGEDFGLLLLGRYRAGAATQALVINPDGSTHATLDLSSQVLSFDAAGRYFSLLTGDGLTIYSTDGAVSSALENTQNARYTALSPNGTALLADQQEAWLFIPG